MGGAARKGHCNNEKRNEEDVHGVARGVSVGGGGAQWASSDQCVRMDSPGRVTHLP